jgi:23S rRNA (cytidine1920-2'-O)/16S rRNA (cytidine1409-2'-O)-methyltransferase
MRLDQYIQQKFKLESRHQAQRLIVEGVVHVNGKAVDKSSYAVAETDAVEITDRSILKFVSRGGLKLEQAIKFTELNVKDYYCLDVGQSTGGFTDCLLQSGAKHIVGIEVGHGQLHENLKGHPQITNFEKTHVLEVKPADILTEELDLIVVDLSFISITKVIAKLKEFSSPKTKILALVKPQFEVGSAQLTKSGLVKDPESYDLVKDKIMLELKKNGLRSIDYFQAFPKGGDGNQEFFVFASNIS